MSVISIATKKGGTSKTTTTINVAAALKRMGYSVLLSDDHLLIPLTGECLPRKGVESLLKLLQTMRDMHTDIRLAMAQKRGEDIFTYAPHSKGAMDYEALAVEFVETLSALSDVPNTTATPEPVLA